MALDLLYFLRGTSSFFFFSLNGYTSKLAGVHETYRYQNSSANE
jgi:hypothetical protein